MPGHAAGYPCRIRNQHPASKFPQRDGKPRIIVDHYNLIEEKRELASPLHSFDIPKDKPLLIPHIATQIFPGFIFLEK